MNVQQGDIAVVHSLVIDISSNDMLVDCLEWVHSFGVYTDPNGMEHYNDEGVAMACKSIGNPFFIFNSLGHLESNRYTIFSPQNLRPIRDNPGQDETLTWLDVPSTDKVTA